MSDLIAHLDAMVEAWQEKAAGDAHHGREERSDATIACAHQLASMIRAHRDELLGVVEDRKRLDSGCIRLVERDEFGDAYFSERAGIDLRKAIDAARHGRGE